MVPFKPPHLPTLSTSSSASTHRLFSISPPAYSRIYASYHRSNLQINSIVVAWPCPLLPTSWNRIYSASISSSPFSYNLRLDTLAFPSLWFSRSQDVMKRTIVHRQAHKTLQLPSVYCRPHSTKHASGMPQTGRETRSTPPSPIPYPTLARSISSIISHNHHPTHSDLHQTSP